MARVGFQTPGSGINRTDDFGEIIFNLVMEEPDEQD